MENKLIRSGPFTSVNGDRAYKHDFFTDYFASFIGNGVFPNPSNNLQVLASRGLNIVVKKGRAWINGQVHLGDTDTPLMLTAGNNTHSRIDKIVLKVDFIDRTITKQIKQGTPATNPVAPTLQRDDDAYELGLANIVVGRAATQITQSNITDLRLNKSECGIVKGLVEEVDTTTLFNEYQTWITEKKAEYNADLMSFTDSKKLEWIDWAKVTQTELETEFDAWFLTIKDVLDEDTVGNLLNLINDIPKVLSGSTEPNGIRRGDTWLRELV